MHPIVVLGYNKVRLTLQCIESALDAGYDEGQITLVDNGSLPGTYDFIGARYPRMDRIRLDQNRGYTGGFNAGLKHALRGGYPAVFFTSNDVLFRPGVVEACESLAVEQEAELVTPAVMQYRHPERWDSIGGWFDGETLTLNHCREAGLPPLLGKQDYIPGAAFWISAKAFRALHGTDETYHTYWEDVDLSFRARAAGMRLARCYAGTVLHGGGMTCRKKYRYTVYHYWRNRIRFCRRHLKPAEWENAKEKLTAELKQCEYHWSRCGDRARMAYLDSLYGALDICRENHSV